MNSYRYRITVEALTGAKGEPVQGRRLTFEAANHDDILAIVERMKSFSEVALVHRTDPIFETIRPALRDFVQGLKQMPQLGPQESVGRLL